MDEDRFEDVLRDLSRSYNPAPPPPLDDMWTVIEDAHFNAPIPITTRQGWASRSNAA